MVAVVGDGQVSRGSEVVKNNAVKVRRIGGGAVISGFAGSTADCLALRERLESKLEAHPGQVWWREGGGRREGVPLRR
jgi:ATP-dependent HslUV protease, peptidase subunit HslV